MSSYLWQNFLTDASILSRIAQEIKDRFSDLQCTTLIEIWPGKWALTKRIMNITDHMLLIEYDEKMVEHLQGKVLLWKTNAPILIKQDILVWDEADITHFPYGPIDDTLRSKTLVVGNLPYYITSPILRKFFASTACIWAAGVFLVQKEVAEKIVYDAPKKSFLWWLLNYAYRVEYCFSVPPKAFTPPPKVTSAVIRVIPKLDHEIPHLSYTDLILFLDQYSPFKRKTLWASSKIVAKLHKRESELRPEWDKKNLISDMKIFDITPFAKMRLEELGWKEMEKMIAQ